MRHLLLIPWYIDQFNYYYFLLFTCSLFQFFHPVAFRKSKRLSKGNTCSNNNWVYLHFNVFSSLSLILDTFHTFPARIGIWKCWFLRRGKNQSTLRKTSRSRVENQQQTQPHDAGFGNPGIEPGNIGGRRALSPLRHPCSQKFASTI